MCMYVHVCMYVCVVDFVSTCHDGVMVDTEELACHKFGVLQMNNSCVLGTLVLSTANSLFRMNVAKVPGCFSSRQLQASSQVGPLLLLCWHDALLANPPPHHTHAATAQQPPEDSKHHLLKMDDSHNVVTADGLKYMHVLRGGMTLVD